MSMSETGAPEPKTVGVDVQTRPEPQSPGVASGNTLNDMRWSVAEGSTEASGSRAGGLKQTNNPNELGGLTWGVAPADAGSGGVDSVGVQDRGEDHSAQPVTDTQAVTGDSGVSSKDRMAGTEWSVAQPDQENSAQLQSIDVVNLSGKQLVEAISTVSQNPSIFDQATLDGLSSHPQMTEALRALADPSEASQQLSQITAEATRRVSESIQRVVNESFNPQATSPENVLDHLRKVAAKPGAMTGEELVKLHTYLQDSSDSASLTNQLVDLDPKVFDHMQTLSQELERRGMRGEELARMAAIDIEPELAEGIADAEMETALAEGVEMVQAEGGEEAQITMPDGTKTSVKAGLFMAACFAFDVMNGGRSLDLITERLSQALLIKLGVDPEIIQRFSSEQNMSLRYLDMLNDDQINKWFGEQLKGREIYNILKIFKDTERTKLMSGERFQPHQVTKSVLKDETLTKMWEELSHDGVSKDELAKLGLTYPATQA